MYKKLVWPFIVLLSISLIGMFIIGFSISVNISNEKDNRQEVNTLDIEESPINTDVEKEDTDLKLVNPKILVIGDSIGFGFGDDGNEGIGNRYAKLIDNDLEKNPVNNLSVSGDEVSDLEWVVNNEENKRIISDMDLIIISIGGNDLNRITFTDPVDLEINYQETLESYKESLVRIINRIRQLNPEAQLALVGLYDPYANNDQKTKLLLNWNYETRLLIQEESKFAYIPTYENFQYHLDEYLAFDEFHPSAKGYQVIAEELYKILNGIK